MLLLAGVFILACAGVRAGMGESLIQTNGIPFITCCLSLFHIQAC